MPLVLSDKVEELKKTKEAVGVLRKLKAWDDIEKVSIFHNYQFNIWLIWVEYDEFISSGPCL